MSKKLLGEQHPDVATSIHNLANLYYSQGKYEQAEPLYLQALSILFSSLGENHPNTLTTLDNFGYFLQEVIKATRVKELSAHPYTQSLLKELFS